jgi:hypothetical protein
MLASTSTPVSSRVMQRDACMLLTKEYNYDIYYLSLAKFTVNNIHIYIFKLVYYESMYVS